MQILIGLAMLFAGIAILVKGRAGANGWLSATIARPGMEELASLLVTMLIGLGAALAVPAAGELFL